MGRGTIVLEEDVSVRELFSDPWDKVLGQDINVVISLEAEFGGEPDEVWQYHWRQQSPVTWHWLDVWR